MHHTPTSAVVQTARADAIGKALKQTGWSTRPEPRAAHPGAVRAEVHTPPNDTAPVRLLVLTLSERRGQIAELTSGAVPPATRRAGGKQRGG